MAHRHVLMMLEAAANSFLNDRSGREMAAKVAGKPSDRRMRKPGETIETSVESPRVVAGGVKKLAILCAG